MSQQTNKTKASPVKKTVPPDTNHRRLDHFLADSDLNFTRSKIQKLIKNGDVSVNKIITVKNSLHINPGDVLSIQVSDSKPLSATPENIPLDIVFEDETLLVVNKPAGMVVHPACGNWQSTLVNALLYHCHKLSNMEDHIRPGIVHRLDKDTSGLLVVAKRDDVHATLAKQLSDRKMARKYVALVWGHLKNNEGTIDTAIGRHPRERQRMAVLEPGNGRQAITHYHIEREYTDCSQLSIKLETGRTHQIRVHLAHLSAPVLGDPIYGGRLKWISRLSPPRRRIAKQALDLIDRQALHAATLGFYHPIHQEWLEFQAPLPNDMGEIIKLFSTH